MPACGGKNLPIDFGATHWSLVRRAGQASVATRRLCLEILLPRYLPALRAHLTLDKRIPAERADDLLQGFIADKVVEQNLVALADPARGKFRSFLLAALNCYVIDQYRHDHTARRAARPHAMSDKVAAEEPESHDAQPCQQFEVIWARELIAQALRLMREECQQTGREDIWEVFECRVVRPAFEGAEPMAYETLIEKFALGSPLQAYNLLTTGKRIFVRLLRSAAGEYATDDASVDEEINDLKSILARFSR